MKLLCYIGIHKWKREPIEYQEELDAYIQRSIISAVAVYCVRCRERRIVEP